MINKNLKSCSRVHQNFYLMTEFIKHGMILMVKGYKQFVSPLLPPSCRFYPTCSEYMISAIEKHGPLKGLFLGLKRLLRCNPFFRGGYDPVP